MKRQTQTEVEARFRHYPPRSEEEMIVHETIRAICKSAANELINLLPGQVVKSREFSQTLTDLENAMMHANAAYARNK